MCTKYHRSDTNRYQILSDFLVDAGFKPLSSDFSVFTKGSMYVAVYVNDLLLIGPHITDIEIVKVQLGGRLA